MNLARGPAKRKAGKKADKFDFEELGVARRKAMEKKWLPCLGWCGKLILTDRGHRFCAKCTARQARIAQTWSPREIPFADVMPSDLPSSKLAI